MAPEDRHHRKCLFENNDNTKKYISSIKKNTGCKLERSTILNSQNGMRNV